MKQHGLSIRNVLISLGTLSTLIVAVMAGFGLLGIQYQLDARQRIVVLDEALHNHNEADAFMDDLRTDVLRALQTSAGVNKESATAIRAALQHHHEGITASIAENLALPLPVGMHDNYLEISGLSAVLLVAAHSAVELALTDPVAGAANFEHFRGRFTDLEKQMDSLRDVLGDMVHQVRHQAALTASRTVRTIAVSSFACILLLVLITAMAIRIARGITSDLANSREEAHRLSLHDALTGLPNRAFFAQRLSHALEASRRSDAPLAVLFLDLDRFKPVNDTFGHSVGDALLRAAAERLRGCLRGSDTVARLGGDEFAVIQAPLRGADEVSWLAQRIVSALSQPYELEGCRVVISTSVGIALAPADATDADSLLKMADLALYRAKAVGRGTWRFFELGMDAKHRRKAVPHEVELQYQPMVEFNSGRETV